MKFTTALRGDARRRIERIEKADILVGIPSYNNEETIAYVIRMAGEGLATYYPDLKCVIMVADGGSTDDTREVAFETEVPPWVEKIVTIYRGIPGKGTAFRAIFEAVENLGVRTCVVCDSDLRSITPEWIKYLADPILKHGYQYVSPLYARYKYDGTITNNIVYTLTRALYGKQIRQPIGGDFGFSQDLAKFYSDQDIWDTDIARYGIDIWMTTLAITEGFRICQSRLGVKIHDPKDPATTLGAMFRQVVMTLFTLMSEYESLWKGIKGSSSTEIFGEEKMPESKPVQVDLLKLIDNFRLGFDHFGVLWKEIIGPENYNKLIKIGQLGKKNITNSHLIKEFYMPIELWVKIIYDFASTFHKWAKDKYKLVDVMTPLYYGKVASFVIQTKDMTSLQAEEVIEEEAVVFEKLKPYLLEKWEGKHEKVD